MADKSASRNWPSTLGGKVEALVELQVALRAETQRAETSEALTRTRLGEALLQALTARADAEARARRMLLERWRAAGWVRPDRRNRARRLAEKILGKLMWPGRMLVLARSGLWRGSDLGAMATYVRRGADSAASPAALFDQAVYLDAYPDVTTARMSPLVHYLLGGADEGRSPHPLFDAGFYAAANAHDLAATGLSPLVHFVRIGAGRGCDPHPLFDIAHYLSQAPDLVETGENPVDHYLRKGAAEGLSPHPLFKPDYYSSQVQPWERAAVPLVHYLTEGSARGLRPHPLFDPAWYREHYSEAKGQEPLTHFARFAGAQLQNPGPWFESARYAQNRGAVRPVHLDPLTDYLRGGAWSAAVPADGMHPVAFFLAHPELAGEGVTPLEHWAAQAGWSAMA